MTTAKAVGIGLVVGGLFFAVAACSNGNGGSSSEDAGGSSSGGSSSGASSGGASSSGGSSGAGSGSSSGGTDGGGVQDFSVFVTNLVQHDTTATATPAALPAPGSYTDNQSLADYPPGFFQ